MQTTVLGRTQLQVTVAGLGAGGFSRLGLNRYGEDYAAGIVRAAFEGGVNFFDTSALYGTEGAVGKGLQGIPRDRYVLSTKFPYATKEGKIQSAKVLMDTLDTSLRLLQTDVIDIYHLHAVTAGDYPEARDTLVPALEKAKQQGKIRFAGITELFDGDTGHEMLAAALPDDLFDVVMVGYNLLNPSAEQRVFPLTLQKNVGVLCMFAVRTALSNPEHLKVDVRRILDAGQADPAKVVPDGTLDFLVEEGYAQSIMEAAYRFCRNARGVDVTLTGTGNAEHLQENLASLRMPPLPDAALERLADMFGRVDCVSGQ